MRVLDHLQHVLYGKPRGIVNRLTFERQFDLRHRRNSSEGIGLFIVTDIILNVGTVFEGRVSGLEYDESLDLRESDPLKPFVEWVCMMNGVRGPYGHGPSQT